ncbi:MAG: hypothetical protein ACM3JH_16035, partial [Acidithiobacillales bacterium]
MTDPRPPEGTHEITADVREALTELQRYLSDSIPPLMVAESLTLLLDYPVELTSFEINAWTSAQFRSKLGSVPVSDYLYHAVDKIFQLGSFGLIPRERLRAYLDVLIPLVVRQCPEEDRDLLRANLTRLGEGDAVGAAAVEVVRRQVGSRSPMATEKGATAGGEPGTAGTDLAKKLRRFSLLLERWEASAVEKGTPVPAAGPGAGGAVGETRASGAEARETTATEKRKKNEVILSQLLSNAAAVCDSDKELAQALDGLRRIGLEMQTADAFRVLGRALPGWVVPPGVEPLEQTGSTAGGSAGAAIRKIVTLPEDPVEVGKRFHEMLQAAVEQFNKGSLPRAAKMFEVAERLIAEKRIDAKSAEGSCRRAFDALDVEKLRSLGEHPEKHPLLRKILNFFPALRVKALLDVVRVEEKRERRRLFLSLLEIHGAEARDAALERLEQMARNGEAPAEEWHFKRNLVYLLRRVPRRPDQPAEPELGAVVQLS